RVETRCRAVPVVEMRGNQAARGKVASPAIREMRRGVFRRSRVREDVWLVWSLVHCGASQLGEPDRLALWRPGRRRRAFDAARAVEMQVRPPAEQILVAEYPGLAVGAIGDRRADARQSVAAAGIVPVEALARR